MLKKKVNINLILALVLVAGLLMIPITMGIIVNEVNGGLNILEEDISGAFEDGEIDTVEGHGIIFEGAVYGFGVFSVTMLIVIIFMVGGYAGLLFIFAVLARIVFAKTGGRLLAYRILMGIEYVLQAGIVVFLISILLDGFDIVFLILTLMVTAGLIYSGINTYTKRICE